MAENAEPVRIRVALAIRRACGHPPLEQTPGAQLGERWLRMADAAMEQIVESPTGPGERCP